nr:unnamed protein product [Naegleria fowleri]
MEDFVLVHLVPLIDDQAVKTRHSSNNEHESMRELLEKSILSFTHQFIDLQTQLASSLIPYLNHTEQGIHSLISSSNPPQQISPIVLNTLHVICRVLMLKVRSDDFWQFFHHDDEVPNHDHDKHWLKNHHSDKNEIQEEEEQQIPPMCSELEISNRNISSSLIIVETCFLYFIQQLFIQESQTTTTDVHDSTRHEGNSSNQSSSWKQLLFTGKYLQFALLTFLKYEFLHKCQTLGEEKAIELFNMNGIEQEITERLETLSDMTASKNTSKKTSKFPLKKQIHICEFIFKLLLILPMRSSDEAEEYFNTMLKYSATCHADLAVWYSVSKILQENSQQQQNQCQHHRSTRSYSILFQTLKKKIESFNLRNYLNFVPVKLFNKQDDINKELVLRWICACTILQTLSTEQAHQQHHQRKSLCDFTEITNYYFSNVIGKGHNILMTENSFQSHDFHFLWNGILDALHSHQITQTSIRGSKYALIDRSQFFSNIDKYILNNDKMSSCENFRTYLSILMKLYFTVSSFSTFQNLNRKLLRLLYLVNATTDMIKILTITECEQNRATEENSAFFNVRHSMIFQLLINSTSINKLIVNSIEQAQLYEINHKPCVQKFNPVNDKMIANSRQLFTHVLKNFVTNVDCVFPTSLRELFATMACVRLDFNQTITPQSMATIIYEHGFTLFYVFERYRNKCSKKSYKYLAALVDYCFDYMKHDDMSFIDQSEDHNSNELFTRVIPSFSEFVRKLCWLDSIFVNTHAKHCYDRKIMFSDIMRRIMIEGRQYFDVEIITVR